MSLQFSVVVTIVWCSVSTLHQVCFLIIHKYYHHIYGHYIITETNYYSSARFCQTNGRTFDLVLLFCCHNYLCTLVN